MEGSHSPFARRGQDQVPSHLGQGRYLSGWNDVTWCKNYVNTPVSVSLRMSIGTH